MTDNTTDFFDNLSEGAGAPSALLKSTGDTVQGEIVKMFKRDYVPFGKDTPEADASEPDGKRKQLVIIVQTNDRNWANVAKVPKVDPNDPNSAEKAPSEDDGTRAIYVPNRSNIQYAIGHAVAEAKAKPVVGGSIAVKVFNLKDTGKGNPLKEHVARYTAPAAGADFFPPAQGQAPAAAPVQTAPPVQEQAPVAPPVQQVAPAAPAAPAGDPWATQVAPAAPAGDPWATSAPAASQQPPF